MGGRVLRRGAVAVVVLVLVLAAWTAGVLLLVREGLESARADIEAVQAERDPTNARPLLERAADRLEHADRLLAQPGPALVRSVPVLGRTLDAVASVASAGRAAVDGAVRIAAVYASHEPLVSAGRVDVEGVDRLAEALEEAAADTRGPVDRLAAQPLRLVPDAVAGRVDEAAAVLRPLPDALARAGSAARGLAAILGREGRTELLVVLQNNAELRATGGLVTVFAQASVDAGTVRVEAFSDVEDVASSASTAVPVQAPADYERLWGPFLANTTLWTNVNMDMDVPTSSAVLARVAGETTGRSPQAIIWLDVPAMAAVLTATGPVHLADGTSLTAETAVDELLSRAYADFDDTVAAQAVRREQLRQTADAVVGRVLGGGLDVARGVGALGRAVAGRHLAVWAADDSVQADLELAGLAAEVEAGEGDLVSVALHNLGGPGRAGNKLDYYARREVRLAVEVKGETALVHQRVLLRNTAPSSGLPTYVAGTVQPGTATTLAVLALPRHARDAQLRRDGAVLDVHPQPSGDHLVVTDVVTVPPGGQVTWDLVYDLAVDETYTATLVPQPLAHDATLTVRVAGTVRPLVRESAFSEVLRLSRLAS